MMRLHLIAPFALSLLLPATARAWVQTTTCIDEPLPAPSSTPYCEGNEVPQPFSWPQWTVPYHINEDGYAAIDGGGGEISDTLLSAVRESVEAWNEPECSGFEFDYVGLTSVAQYDIDDGVNVIVFRAEQWPHAGNAIAITSVTAELDGTIVNADMELNVRDNEFGFVEEDGALVWDIRNTVTHEAGHMLGLDHSGIAGATMAFSASPGDTDKRTLEADDREGLCTIYPEGESPPPSEPQPEPGRRGCCAVGAAGSRGPLGPMLVGLLVLGLLRFPVRGRRRDGLGDERRGG